MRCRLTSASPDGASLHLVDGDDEILLISEGSAEVSYTFTGTVQGPENSRLRLSLQGSYSDGSAEHPFEVSLGELTVSSDPSLMQPAEGSSYSFVQWEGETVLTGPQVGPGSAYSTVREALALIDRPAGTRLAVANADGSTASGSEPLATGMVLQLMSKDDKVLEEATVVVKGDVCGSGRMNIAQLTVLAAAVTGTRPLTGPYLLAADWNGSGRVDLTDLVREARMLTGRV